MSDEDSEDSKSPATSIKQWLSSTFNKLPQILKPKRHQALARRASYCHQYHSSTSTDDAEKEESPLHPFGILERYKAKRDGSTSKQDIPRNSLLSNIVDALQETFDSNDSDSSDDSNVIVSSIISNLSSVDDVALAHAHLEACESNRGLGRRVKKLERAQSVSSRELGEYRSMQLISNDVLDPAGSQDSSGSPSRELLGSLGRKLI